MDTMQHDQENVYMDQYMVGIVYEQCCSFWLWEEVSQTWGRPVASPVQF